MIDDLPWYVLHVPSQTINLHKNVTSFLKSIQIQYAVDRIVLIFEKYTHTFDDSVKS